MTFHYNFNPFKCSDPKYTLKKYVDPLVVLPVFLLTVKIILQSRTLFCLFEHKKGKHISSLHPHKGQSFVSYWGPKVKAAVFLAGSKEPLCSRGAQQSYSVSSQAAARAASSSCGQRCRSACIQTGEILSSLVLVIQCSPLSPELWKGFVLAFFMCHYKSGLRVWEQKQSVHVNQAPSGIKWALKVSKCEPKTLELWMNPSCQRQCLQCFQLDLGAGSRAGCTQMPPEKTSGKFL